MRFTLRKERKFTYIEEGTGHPLVLLHGLMGGLSNFDALLSYFSERGFRVIVPQLPIYDLPLLNTNVSSIAKFVAKFLDEKVQEPVTLIGNSLGGHVGLVVARKHPEKVHSLILTGSSGLYEKSFGETFPKRGNYEYIKMKTEEVFYDPNVATKEIVDEVYETVNNKLKAIKTLYIARSAMKHNMKDDLPFIHQPTCIIWGKQDSVTPPDVATDMHAGIPNSVLHWIDKCGHAAMMEHPDEFNQLVFNWLESIIKK